MLKIIISLPVWTEAEDSEIKERVNWIKATDKENIKSPPNLKDFTYPSFSNRFQKPSTDLGRVKRVKSKTLELSSKSIEKFERNTIEIMVRTNILTNHFTIMCSIINPIT